MKTDWEVEAHDAYMERLSAASGIPLVNSLGEAKTGWGLRRLSRSEFERLRVHWQKDHELGQRWRRRLSIGYDRELSQIAIEIEEIFADLPSAADRDASAQEEAA